MLVKDLLADYLILKNLKLTKLDLSCTNTIKTIIKKIDVK